MTNSKQDYRAACNEVLSASAALQEYADRTGNVEAECIALLGAWTFFNTIRVCEKEPVGAAGGAFLQDMLQTQVMGGAADPYFEPYLKADAHMSPEEAEREAIAMCRRCVEGLQYALKKFQANEKNKGAE